MKNVQAAAEDSALLQDPRPVFVLYMIIFATEFSKPDQEAGHNASHATRKLASYNGRDNMARNFAKYAPMPFVARLCLLRTFCCIF